MRRRSWAGGGEFKLYGSALGEKLDVQLVPGPGGIMKILYAEGAGVGRDRQPEEPLRLQQNWRSGRVTWVS